MCLTTTLLLCQKETHFNSPVCSPPRPEPESRTQIQLPLDAHCLPQQLRTQLPSEKQRQTHLESEKELENKTGWCFLSTGLTVTRPSLAALLLQEDQQEVGQHSRKWGDTDVRAVFQELYREQPEIGILRQDTWVSVIILPLANLFWALFPHF